MAAIWVTGSFRTSDAARPRGRGLWRARWRALWSFEVRAQLREPLTALYALVFFLLTLGFAASDAVQLVSGRGDVPPSSSWAITLAVGGLTAFGQVITTMIATTAMLRDEALRTRALIATSGVSPRLWFTARVGAALTVMLLVYLAMPLGIVVGSALRALTASGTPASVASGTATATSLALSRVLSLVGPRAMLAFTVVTVPTVLVVTVVLAAAAVRTQRVIGVLVAALSLVALWQLALTLEQRDGTRLVGALLDPFANAPVLAVTRGWTDAQKTADPVPLGTLVLQNRVAWSAVAVLVAGWVYAFGVGAIFAPRAVSGSASAGGGHARLLARLASARTVIGSMRHFTRGWITLDGGWRIVAALAVLNAAANAVPLAASAGSTVPAILAAVHTHARIFLILLATVYAGELVWRDRDTRVDALIAATPASGHTLTVGRWLGALQAQLTIVAPLAALALVLTLWIDPRAATIGAWVGWTVLRLWLPFALLTVGSWIVHAVLDHKVGAHLLLIAGWVVYTALTSPR